jgi:outer membrane protein OmpA-like peptidoglycan-associated protein
VQQLEINTMTANSTPRTRALRAILVAGAALCLTAGISMAAEDITEGQIVRALSPKKPLTRGLSVAAPAQPATASVNGGLLDKLRNRPTRSLSSTEREQIAALAEQRPNIDLEINFDYNSANISAKALKAVDALGKALSNPDLKGSTFVVAGHTDAVGGESYNQDLSERRADAIKRYLVDRFGIAGTDLVTVGYGKSKLKDPSAPSAGVNRRVQVVNMQDKTASQ